MARDKYYAIKKKWRTPEKYLLWQAFLGGSLGILLATLPPLNHKKNDRPFQVIALACLLGQTLLYLLVWDVIGDQTLWYSLGLN